MRVVDTRTLKVRGLYIRPIVVAELPAVARLYLEAFPNSVRSRLGAAAVVKYLERQLTLRPTVCALGAERGGELLGFGFGGIYGEEVGGFIVNNLPLVAARLLARPWLVTELELRGRLLWKWRAWRAPKRPAEPAARLYEVFSLAVKAGARNTGIGKALMAQQEVFALAQDCAAIRLMTPTYDPNTLAFYERIGFQKQLEPAGTWTGQMLKPLKEV